MISVNWVIGLFLIIILFSCGRNHNELHIVFDNGSILENCDSVELNGVIIGTKQRLGLNKNLKAVLSVSIEPEHKIPVDSRFEVIQKDLLHINLIVYPGKSARSLKDGDTVQGTVPEPYDKGVSREIELLEDLVKAVVRYGQVSDSVKTK